MKQRVMWILLLLLLNVADFGITQNALRTGQPVSEANPIIATLAENGGWNAVAAYKVITVLVVAIGLTFVFNRAAWTRIMATTCFCFTAILVYMIAILLVTPLFL